MLNYKFLLDKYCSGCRYECIGNSYEGISWYETEQEMPSKEQFNEWWEESEQEYSDILNKQEEIAKKRKSEYPDLEDLIVALWEYTIEGSPEKAVEVQNLRRLVKEKYQLYSPE